ncbi:MAG: ribbon-helix-helix domain-containing protein [Roseovarius sp.]|nr:ribbon-helix-helix domain-containing protein [Roseovarius sp.]MCY4293212.1 ribbon-helix-helix domain-containing protein [Roseovarius sp.]MCY4315931.1 ribbon-helix-helix domain-containing protein [Roseovarius sp.]
MRPVKRSLTINGHRTSVSLEEDFWFSFRQIARRQRKSINALATEIDNEREILTNLASAIRVYVLRYHQEKSMTCNEDLR